MAELTRRELLESVTTATALGAGAAALAACGRDGALPLQPPPALLAKGLTSGLVLPEGYRMITWLLGLSLDLVVAGRAPGHPNWIDTAGHGEGPMSLRWARGDESVPEVRTRVVPIDALAQEGA